MGGSQIRVGQVGHRFMSVLPERSEEQPRGVHSRLGVAQNHLSTISRMGIPADVARVDQPVDQVGDRGARQTHALAEIPGRHRLTGRLGDHDVQQRAEVGRPNVVGDSEDPADLVGFRRQLPQISRDLRFQCGPLAAAKVAVSSLRTEDVAFSPEDTAELLATIEESIDQLTALVANLLDSSRLAAGVIRPQLRRAYLEEAVQRALVSIGKGATGFYRSGIDRVKVDVGDAVAMADAGLLERVLANLIDNALRYAPDCVVRVNAGRVRERVLINVIDEGPGVPRGTEEQLFAPFQRPGDHDNTTGVGLGMSVARGFVEAMGGTISATDTPGGGLTVVIDLAAPEDRP